LAFRVLGTGSVGLRSYVALLRGNENEDLVLQLKKRSAAVGVDAISGT
jgi:uncharacterized protein (DUF2252 family)